MMITVTRSILFASLITGAVHADLLLDDFEHGSTWVTEGRDIDETAQSTSSVTVSITDDAAEGKGAMLVTHKAAEAQFYWLTRTCPDGVWNWSGYRTLTLWLRGDGGKPKRMYAKAVDERGRQMFWRLGTLTGTDWQRFTVDISQDVSVFRHENPNLARVAQVGIRCDPDHGYAFAVDLVELTDPLGVPVKAADHPEFSLALPKSYLTARSTEEVEDSIVGVSLQVGTLTTAQIDRLAAAGVKWAERMPLGVGSPYAQKIRAHLLHRKFRLFGHLGINRKPTDEELANRLENLRRTVTALRDDIRVWDIGNEPNLAKFWKPEPNPVEFGQTVIAYAKVIRDVDPEATIVTGGLVGYDMEFTKGMLSTGMGDWVDVIGIHTPRWRPEYARDQSVDHADALAQFRALIESANPKLVVWQTEVQAVGGVHRAESGISDYEQARHIARRFLYEHKLGIPVSFWQLLKAISEMEHPGALLRADDTPTVKYCAIRSVASVLDNTLKPVDVPVEIEDQKQPGSWLYRSGPLAVTTRWKSPAIPVPARQNIDLTATVKTGAETVDTRLIWVDAAGEVLESISDETPVTTAADGTTSVCRRYPPDFRPRGARAVRVVVAATDAQPIDIRSLEVAAGGTSLTGKPRVLTFEREGKLHISWWLDPRPTPISPLDRCTIRVRCAPGQLAKPVYADLIDGAVRPATVRRDGDWTVLENLPLTDYSFILADQSSFNLTSTAPMIDDFASPEDLTKQYVGDRFGLGRPEYWRRVDWAFSDMRTPLAKAYRRSVNWFGKRLEPTAADVTVTDVPVVEYRHRELAWRSSVVNSTAQHVDRYFLDLETRGMPAHLRVLDRERELMEGKWEDSSERAGQWFVDARRFPRLFMIVPKGKFVPRNLNLISPSGVEFQPTDLNWRADAVNSQTLHVDRYYLRGLENREISEQLRVLSGERELPRGEWEDSPERAGQWFLEMHPSPPRLFVIVPKGQPVSKNCNLIYPVEACRPILHTFRDSATDGACLVLWSETLGELPEFSGEITLSGRADTLPAQAAILDLVTGRELRQVQATEDGDRRRLAGIPINPEGIMVVDGALRTQAD